MIEKRHGLRLPVSGMYVERAYGKINLFLYVGPKRDDGFHEIATLIQTLALHDHVTMTWDGVGTGRGETLPEIQVTSDDPALPRHNENLAGKAVERLKEALTARGATGGTLHIHVTKRIPVAAGLGGGSADAAAVLRGLNRVFQLGLSPKQLMKAGADIGSDVPASVLGGTLLCRGRGEAVTPLAGSTLWWVLANPGGDLKAGDVYGALAGTGRRKSDELDERLNRFFPDGHSALRRADVNRLTPYFANDLESAVVRMNPGSAALLRRLKGRGARAVFVSGSGPTVAGLVEDAATAKNIADQLQGSVPWVWWGPSMDPNASSILNRDGASLCKLRLSSSRVQAITENCPTRATKRMKR